MRPLLILAITLPLGSVDQIGELRSIQEPVGAVCAPSSPASPAPRSAQQPPAKPAVPPLFPRHRRGLYKNGLGLEVMDFTPQSPPLGTDDPSVPDKHAYEVNFSTFADRSNGSQALDLLLIDANYGLAPTVFGRSLPTQLKFEFPIAAIREGDEPYTMGAGAAMAGLKFNFYENEDNGLSVSVYPQLEFSLPGSRAAAKGLADEGQTVVLPVLVSKQFKYVTLVVNAGLDIPVHDPARDVIERFRVGWGLPIRRKLAAMAEVSVESAIGFRHDRLVVINVGVMRGFGRHVILYGNIGRSVFADDGAPHIYAGAGMKIVSPRW